MCQHVLLDYYISNPMLSVSYVLCLILTTMIVLSVLGNLSLALVTATMSFRIYKSVLAAVNKTNEGHPFKVSE